MFISDKLVFIQLHKSGSTHIAKLLSRLVDGRRKGKHNPATPALLESGRNFLGSIRNPWDWYVSLWAYGCDRKGAVYIITRDQGLLRLLGLGWRADFKRALERLRNQKPRNPKAWRRVYADVNDVSCFRDWLYMMNDETYWEEFGEGYAYSPVNRFAGLLTYRYVRLFCRQSDEAHHENLASFEELLSYERQNCYIDHFIRTENLEDDLLAALGRIGVLIPEDRQAEVRASKRTNTSSRKGSTASFYDEGTVSLISDREKLIIKKFGYTAPRSA
jgi:hypothetical protein